MNEELKSGALSSGLLQGKPKQDDHPSSATPSDLNNFLIRRQLLGMEARRIQELLREAEVELKAKQGNLVDVHDRVLASLRNRLDLQDELARS